VHVNVFQIRAESKLPSGNFFANLIQMCADVIAIIRADDAQRAQASWRAPWNREYRRHKAACRS
jgi:hypothetical protein